MKVIYKSLIILFSAAILFVSCEKFLDVNDNPNNPTSTIPKLTLPVAQESYVALQSRQMNYLGNFIVYNWAVPSNWSAMQNEIRYNVTSTFYNVIFENTYQDIFKNITYVINYEAEGTDYTAYKVIGNIIKSAQYQHLVDLYGDVPYSEANMRGQNTTPKYDDAATIYKSLVDSLTHYANLAVNMPDVYEDPEGQDIIFHGDMEKWAQFANTIKLRMLVRLSNTGQDAYIKQEIGKIDANGAGYLKADVFAQPGYSDDADKQNPYYGYIGMQPGGKAVTDRNDYTVASDYALDYLMSTNDERYMRLYSESKDTEEYKGVWQATALPGSGYTAQVLSHVGPGLLIGPAQDQIVFMAAESMFLQAEAIVRGYIAGGDAAAKNMYENGIAASYHFLFNPGRDKSLEITSDDVQAMAEEYYAQTLPNVSWNSSSNKIEAIITQKAIALNGSFGHEAWIELTRTGFPKNVPIPDEAVENKKPVRLLYPQSEIARNNENVPKQTQADAFTKYPFWK